jgi:hypothetical protein
MELAGATKRVGCGGKDVTSFLLRDYKLSITDSY